jgi:hypothetical protein
MRKPLKIMLFLLIAVPAFFAGCQKSEVLNDATPIPVKSVQVILPYTPCGTQLVANLYEYGKTGTSYGTVTVGNDATNLYITYQTSGNYNLQNTHLYVGTPEGLPSTTTPSYINPDGTGYFHYGTPPFQDYAPGPPAPAYQKVIPLSSLPECFIIVAFGDIATADPTQPIIVSAKTPTAYKSLGYYLEYCKQVCGSGCETAYAYGKDKANCFLTIPGVTSNNWGWSNGPIEAGTYDWPIYAGAGQCDISKGTLVGNLHVVYAPPTATITFNMGSNVRLSTTHLYVGTDILAKKNNKWTTAPGQFPNKHENMNGVNTDSYTITGLSGKIYIAAHSDVCW